ncbi:MAG: cyclic nucleotide-binding domain-containing protein [Acidimicrobiia bacterium]
MVKVRKGDRIELLQSVWLFERCTPKELQAIAKLATPLLADDGQVLAREGQIGGEFFVIVEGTAEATIDGRHIATLGPGQFFGEMALLDRGPRVATVVARSSMLLLVLSGREFEELIGKAIPSVSRRMLMVLGQRLREADEQLAERGSPRLAGL